MPLTVTYVRSLAEIVDHAVDFLGQPTDLFTTQHIVLPTVGARAWLAAELMRRLGVTTADAGDGIVAGVDFSFPGSIARLALPGRYDEDPWAVDRLTFAVLDVLVQRPQYQSLCRRAGGPLLAARRVADRFDHYHFRRPGMILAWEAGQPTLAATATDEPATAEPAAPPLATADRWQFEIWQAVRAVIGEPSPPARERQAAGPVPEGVLVAGLQGLSQHQIELLTGLAERTGASGKRCDVRAVLVHPSPPLAERWAALAPPHSPGRPPIRGGFEQAEDVDPLVSAWLRGSCEAQWLLASQGICPVHPPAATATPSDVQPSLLARLKQTVSSDLLPTVVTVDPADDSVRIHRCHDLGRQAEVLYDAILHAFREHPDLAPHEIAIVSPQIAALAPHLEAVFARRVEGDSGSVELPLLVADRGIREVSGGAELLAAVLQVVGSRCSVEDMVAVATHPLVQAHFGCDDQDVEVWQRCIDRTRIRWGLDGPRRGRDGLDQPELAAHTWWLGLERMLLGATIPDGFPEPVLGGVVPLTGIDTADLEAVAPLVTIVGIIDELDQAVAEDRPVAEWCDRLEVALLRLAGDESDALEAALREIDTLRQPATPVPVPFHDVKTILAGMLAAAVGRQPLRTGAITATSLIPLRGVPFRVICLAGFDEAAVAPQDGDSDDLVERQRLLGDADPRLDIRRSLLDCLLAAGDQLIITCTGMSVATNATLPLVTPLAEFVEFVDRHGVPPLQRNGETYSGIEVFHPRHACSRKNFVLGAVRPGTPWSHAKAARQTAAVLGAEPARCQPAATVAPPRSLIELKSLASFLADPLWPYVRETLSINPWRVALEPTPATLPLELSRREQRDLRDDFLRQRLATAAPERLEREWVQAVQADGEVPIWGYGDTAIAEIVGFSAAVVDQAIALGMPLDQRVDDMLRIDLEGIQLVGHLERSLVDQATLVLLRPEAMQSSQFSRSKYLAVVQLLMAAAAGVPIDKAVVLSQHEKWSPGAVDSKGKPLKAVQQRVVALESGIEQATAQRLLTQLTQLYQRAATEPFGQFGKTAEDLLHDRTKAKETFAGFVGYAANPGSLEVVVHGLQPRFEDVFHDREKMLAFFELYLGLTTVSYVRPRYIYQPR